MNTNKKMKYDEYLKYNIDKNSNPLKRQSLLRKKREKIKWFTKKFKMLKLFYKNKKVLCLGSRMGEEVEAFISLGANATGVDLVPYPPLVLKGDMNHLDLKEKFDYIFTNSFDHVYDIDLWIKGIQSILRPNGILILNIYPSIFNSCSEIVYTETEEEAIDIIKKYLTLKSIEKTSQWFKQYPEKIYLFEKTC